MVFESLVVDLINRYLGDFVENLDPSQLKIGIWGGDVVLNNLDIKESALDDLDLPVKVKAGHIGHLVLKIPWKNLYSAPVIAEIDGIYALAVPNIGIKYNEEKEEKAAQEAKQRKLTAVEEAKKYEAEKNKPSDPKQDSFAEKLATQVIKNLQVRISNIHVRYEDRHTNPSSPFAIGVTLNDLQFQTTDENWKPCIIKEAVTQIYKLVKLDAVAVYWNSKCQLYENMERETLRNVLKGTIASPTNKPNFQYLIKPISSVAHLRLHTKPENFEFSMPKIFLTIVFDEISIGLMKSQYNDIMEMLESFERMNLRSLYRKYRPELPFRGHIPTWWNFAQTAVLEETVRRRRKMWSWNHIKEHRDTMKKYRAAYIKKLESKGKPSSDVAKTLEACEKSLDSFCIIIMRQEAEVEAAKLGAKRKEEAGQGWFGGWFGGGKKKKDSAQGDSIQDEFYKQFTSEEKAKLYNAIGYDENIPDPTLPKDYVALRLVTRLNNINLSLKDANRKDPQLLKLQLKNVFTSVSQRPSASAISVEAKLDKMTVMGTPQDAGTPRLVMSQVQEQEQVFSLIDFGLETNPLHQRADTCIRLKSRPLEVVYDAVTINNLGAFFTPPESVHLKQLSQAAMAQFDTIKEQSTAGLQHAIDQHKYTEIQVDLMSSYVLVPHGGFLTKDASMLLLDLGSVSVKSEPSLASQQQLPKSLSVDQLKDQAYDKFIIDVSSIQLLYLNAGEDWNAARRQGVSRRHVLEPLSIHLLLEQCLFDKDPGLAKMRLSGELPLLGVRVSDKRIQEILSLVESLPAPATPEQSDSEEIFQTEEEQLHSFLLFTQCLIEHEKQEAEKQKEPSTPLQRALAKMRRTAILEKLFGVPEEGPSTMLAPVLQEEKALQAGALESTPGAKKKAGELVTQTSQGEMVNMTTMRITFEIKQVCIQVDELVGDEEKPMMKLMVEQLGTQVMMRTFDMSVSVYLGAIYLQHLKFKVADGLLQQFSKDQGYMSGGIVNLVNTVAITQQMQHLLYVNYVKADRDGPEFATTHGRVEQLVEVEFAGVEVLLHQTALVSLLEFIQSLTPQQSPSSQTLEVPVIVSTAEETPAEATPEKKKSSGKKGKKQPEEEIIDMKVKAKLNKFAVGICTEQQFLANVEISGLDSEVTLTASATTVGAVLSDVTIFDPMSGTRYPKLMSMSGAEVLKLDLIMYNNGTEGSKFNDMTCVDMFVKVTIGRITFVYLNRFVADLLRFLDQFQVAKDKLAEAGEAVAESAATAVQSMQETSSRISLDVRLQAPLIIMPQASSSANAVLLDLGTLEVTNSFHTASKLSPLGVPAVLEKMNIVLTSVKITRAIIGGKSNLVEAECYLLAPINLSLRMTRNLSAAWYHDVPDIDIFGKLKSISFELSQVDYGTVMAVMNDNFAEETRLPPEVAVTVETLSIPTTARTLSATPRASPRTSPSPSRASAVKASKTSSKTSGTSAVYTYLRLSFDLSSVALTLYSGSSPLTQGLQQRNVDHGLAKMEFQALAVQLDMKSDSSMVCRVTLADMVLDDLRPPKRGGITSGPADTKTLRFKEDPAKAKESEEKAKESEEKAKESEEKEEKEELPYRIRMIGSTRIPVQAGTIKRSEVSKAAAEADKQQLNMIDVTYTQNVSLDQDVMVHMSSLYVCVCLEYMMGLANFFTMAQAQTAELTSLPAPQSAKPREASRTSAMSVSSKTTKMSKPKAEVPAPAPPAAQGEMNIVVTMEKPEIILLEDSSNPSSNAVILDVGLNFRMRMTPDVTTMQAGIKDMRIISCTYDSKEETQVQILQPCDVNFLSSQPTDQGAHMDITVTDFVLNVSPQSIRTLAAISSTLQLPAEDTGEKKEETIPDNLWMVRKLAESDFWYLKPTKHEETKSSMVEAGSSVDSPPDTVVRGEQLMMKMPVLIIKLEGGVGDRTVPLLILESSFQGQVLDWSTKMAVESSLTMEVAYYNEALAVWEPLLEPILDGGKRRRWELGLEVMMNDDVLPPVEEDEEGAEVIVLPPPVMTINIKSADALQLTLTKSGLDVIYKLSQAFTDAYNLKPLLGKKAEETAPFIFHNHTGTDIVLKLDPSFQPPPQASGAKVKVRDGEALPTHNRAVPGGLVRKASLIKATQEADERKIIFQVEQFGATREVTIKRAEKRLFQINQRSYSGDVWAIVCCTETDIGQKNIYLRSIVQVLNHLPVPVELYYRGDSQPMACGQAQPGQVFSVPLSAVYSLTGELFFKVDDGKHKVSGDSLKWKGLENAAVKQVSCDDTDPGHSAFHFNVETEVESIYFEAGNQMTAKSYLLHLRPTVFLHNLLPMPLTYILEGTESHSELQKGENIPLFHASINQSTLEVMLPNYQGREWTGRRQLQTNVPELSVWTFESFVNGAKVTMDLGLHCKMNSGSFDVSIYSPYWMLNKTSRDLHYRPEESLPLFGGEGSDAENCIEHSGTNTDVVLFSFKAKNLFGQKKKDKEGKSNDSDKKVKVKEMKQSGKSKEEKKEEKKAKEEEKKNPILGKAAQLQVSDSEWSDKFSLDVVGSSGTVQCKTKTGRVYEVGVSIRLSTTGLTKIVTFTPFYMLLNLSENFLLCTEVKEHEDWVEVAPKECKPFWPEITAKEMKMKAKVKDSSEMTANFLFNKAHTTLLRLNNQYGGINTECAVTDSAMVTTLKLYKPGMATVQIVNHALERGAALYFNQFGSKVTHTVGAEETLLYTWDDPLGKREITWSCGKQKDKKTDLLQDDIGDFFVDSDTKIFWVSFLDGMQRVLLLTQDIDMATRARQAGELERADQEINVSIQGLGLSLVNNLNQTEVAFLGITSSGIIWEEKRKRYKAFGVKDCTALENAYQNYLSLALSGKTPESRMTLDNKMEVDFGEKDQMMMFKPNKRVIRRSFVDGVWFQYRSSPHQVQLHAKINRLQLDNQLSQAIFPTVLSPIPPPKSVAADSVPKPFAEVSIMTRYHEFSNVAQYKYFKVLVQEMQLKVDQGFLNAIIQLFASDQSVHRELEAEQLELDYKCKDAELMEVVGLSLAEEQKNFYDYLHFSPIKCIHLSFSLQAGAGSGDSMPIQANILNVFLQSVGVVLTDVQDVVFKLGYFERTHTFYNKWQLTSEMTSHYVGQAIKQMYVLVLGLDVLGNPFGLLRGLSEGVTDLFYEPYQGAIQGPEEFAEGLALGVRSLFGHAVGGAAGAVSRITGTLGKGMAALTLDDDYQRKRREQLNKRPANAREGFARGGKGLVMGVFDGVTGIVRKPVEGAQKEGVGGFFKGVGKGLVGVVTRPTSGVIDFASSSFEGIRRIAEMSDEIRRVRPPRRFHADRIVRPYNHQEAEGYAILQETEKGKYAETDEYYAHVVISKDGKQVFLVTDKRLMCAKRGEIFGSWDSDWMYPWSEVKEKPKKTNKGIEIILKEKEKKKFFGSSSTKRDVPIPDSKLADWILLKIEEVMARQQQ